MTQKDTKVKPFPELYVFATSWTVVQQPGMKGQWVSRDRGLTQQLSALSATGSRPWSILDQCINASPCVSDKQTVPIVPESVLAVQGRGRIRSRRLYRFAMMTGNVMMVDPR